VSAGGAHIPPDERDPAASPPVRERRAAALFVAFAAYLGISLALWWHALAHWLGRGPTVSLPAGSADPGQEVWFLGWLPHALGTAADPFFSHAVFAPAGVNLLANTSVDLVGLLLSPVTVAAGPVAAFWVAVFLAPALSAVGAYVLCRRHVAWWPAAFAGGLVYGFGPFVATDLRYGHLDLTWLVFPPLIFACLDELLLRRARRPATTGALLGVLVVAQFFVSTEMLAVTAVTAMVAFVLTCIARPWRTLAALRAAAPGVAVAAVIILAALSYPAWVAVAGPRHFTGAVWSHVGDIATSLAATVQPQAELPGVAFVSGGNGGYLGVGLIVVLLAGTVVLRRPRALRGALALAAIAFLFSLGYRLHAGSAASSIPLPAALLGHVPLLDSIVPSRFGAMVDLFCGLALAMVLDHVSHGQFAVRADASPPEPADGGPQHVDRAPIRTAMAVMVAAVAMVPLGLLAPWPYRSAPLHRPAVLASLGVGGARTASPVLLAYPDASSDVSDLMVWQAQAGFSYRLPDGYAIVPGPRGRAAESPPSNALWLVFAAAALHRLQLPLSASARRAVDRDVAAMHVREVVVLPGRSGSSLARRALSDALGPPRIVQRAAVWTFPS
jgi:hypothetical protein